MLIHKLTNQVAVWLLSIPWLVRHYKRIIFGSGLAIAISLVMLVLEDAKWNKAGLGRFVFLSLRYAPYVLLPVLVMIAAVYSLWRRLFWGELNYDRVVLNGYYRDDKSYELVADYQVTNHGQVPIRELYGVCEGYRGKPDHVSVKCLLASDDQNYIVKITGPTESIVNCTAVGEALTIYSYMWDAYVEPPLQPGGCIRYVIHIHADNTEDVAFTPGGSTFAWGVFGITHELVIAVHAPPGYYLRLVKYLVYDQSGSPIHYEITRLPEPYTIANGSVLMWRILLPKLHLRYGMQYRLVQVGRLV